MKSSGSGIFLIWASTITLFLSSVIAIRKNDIKARLAYSTVSQLSYIILGGAIGNGIDRLLSGYVIDFIDLYYRNFHWPAFNFADSFITVGAVLFFIKLFFFK